MIFNKNKPLSWLSDLNKVLENVQCKWDGQPIDVETAVEKMGKIFLKFSGNSGSFFWAANGGSAAVCSHLSQDILNKLDIRSFVCSDPSLITCMANDFGYEQVYSKPLARLAQKGDGLIAISSSGNSQNIINAAKVALEKQMALITLSGFEEDNKLYALEKGLAFYLPSRLYGIVEMGHEAILHAVIESLWLEKKG